MSRPDGSGPLDPDEIDWSRLPEIPWTPLRTPPESQIQPLTVGKTKRPCPHCHQPAAVELFRDNKCLACQVADYIGPLK